MESARSLCGLAAFCRTSWALGRRVIMPNVDAFEQPSVLETVSTTCGSGWVRSCGRCPITSLDQHCEHFALMAPTCVRAAHPPAIAGGTDPVQSPATENSARDVCGEASAAPYLKCSLASTAPQWIRRIIHTKCNGRLIAVTGFGILCERS